jgi:hypothetical protein
MKPLVKLSAIIFSFFLSCQNSPKKASIEVIEDLSEEKSEWVNLIATDTFEGWHIYQNENGEKTGWSSENRVFTYDSSNAKGDGNKSLISDEKYTNFEIQFEWKLSPNSNSGFMWGVIEDSRYDAPYLTGPEIQIIDADIYGDDKKNQIHTTGSLYDMVAPDHVMAKPAGEWNSYHITINYKINKGTVVHNGMEINRFPLQGPDWDALVKKSKFADISGFAVDKEGYLCFQDHPGVISYKNIKIKRL